MEQSDRQLIEEYLAGKEEAFAMLLGRHLALVVGFACSMTGDVMAAEDIAQATFIKAWKKLSGFDREKNFKTWLLVIARNTAIDHLRQCREVPWSGFDASEEGESLLDIPDPGPLPDEIMARADLAAELAAVLRGLKPKHRTVVELYYLEGMNLPEIAEVLGEPVNTVKSRFRRTLAIIKDGLAGDKTNT